MVSLMAPVLRVLFHLCVIYLLTIIPLLMITKNIGLRNDGKCCTLL